MLTKAIAQVRSMRTRPAPTYRTSSSVDSPRNEAKPQQSVTETGDTLVVSVTATFGQCAAGWVLDRLASTDQRSSQN